MSNLWVCAQLCLGCGQCVLACSFEKEAHFSPADALLYLLPWEERGFAQPIVCTQCEDAPCAQVCPADAIVPGAAGSLVVDGRRCTECELCIEACPTGVMRIHRRTGKAVKCDLCGGRPACVAVCPWGALTFEDRGWPERERLRAGLAQVREAAAKGETPVALNRDAE